MYNAKVLWHIVYTPRVFYIDHNIQISRRQQEAVHMAPMGWRLLVCIPFLINTYSILKSCSRISMETSPFLWPWSCKWQDLGTLLLTKINSLPPGRCGCNFDLQFSRKILWCMSGLLLEKTSWGKFYHDYAIKWKHFPRYWPFVQGMHRYPVNSPHKGQWRGALMFSLICAWINGWVNNREAGDLRRSRADYDVIVMRTSQVSQLC